MPGATPLLPADPLRIGRYPLTGRLVTSPPRPGSQPSRHGADGRADPGGPAPYVSYLARTDGEQVTITLLQPVSPADTVARERFMATADAARQVRPECLARLLDAGFHGHFPYLVSEHVAGPSLAEVIRSDGALGTTTLRAVAIGAATGLAAIHQAGLVHGTFGPHQLVLGADGPRVVHSGVTPPYGRVTAAADVSAWALTILSAVSGSLGHVSADSRRADLSLLPPPLRQIVRASLSTDPAARPTAQAIAALLLDPAPRPAGALALSAPTGAHSADRRAASGRAAGTPARHAPSGRTGPGGQATGRPGRRRITARAAAAVIAVAALAGGGAVLLSRSAATGPLSTGASQPAGRPAAARPSATVPSAARLSSPATTPAVTTAPPAVRVPGSLSGTWTGRVRQANPPLSFTVRIKLTAGTVAGTVSYPSLACSGVLTLTGQAGRGYVFHQGIVAGQQTCGPGIVTLTGHGARLGFFFIPAPPGGPAVRGTLSR